MSAVITRIFLLAMQWLALLPLPWLRAVGWGLGRFLYAVLGSRRRVVLTNLQLCFPHWTVVQRETCARQVFVHFAQSWLDRGWLWHGKAEVVRSRLRLTGAVHQLQGNAPCVIFAPHFMGLDAAWTALNQQIPRRFATIYAAQLNPVADAWIYAGRQRFGTPEMVARLGGVQPIIAAVRKGEPLYLLPDMNYDPGESVFVPFYGVSACTIPSLSRFAKLGRAKVVPVVTRLTPKGYEIQVLPAWEDFPTADVAADTARMNLELQSYIDPMPDQYYWVHKRFKDRPNGESPPY